MPDRLLSVILPVYNGARFVAEAIESVLAQKYDPLQLIVLNDGSTDDTESVVKSFPGITYIYQENAGVTAARNAALAAATGEFISFIDADDLWHPQKLALQMGFLDANPHVQIVMGRTQFVYMGSAPIRKSGDGFSIYLLTCVFMGSGLYRRSVFDMIGGFNPEIKGGEDVDWFLRTAEQNITLDVIPEVTLYRRLHDENMTNAIKTMRFWMMKAIKQSLDRRRAQGMKYSGPILPWVQLHSAADSGELK